MIEKHGIKRIDPDGEKFDYNLHQAMFELPTDEHEAGMVVEVFSTAMCCTIDCCGQLWSESRRRLIVQPRK